MRATGRTHVHCGYHCPRDIVRHSVKLNGLTTELECAFTHKWLSVSLWQVFVIKEANCEQ
jgi:hypothetical protein